MKFQVKETFVMQTFSRKCNEIFPDRSEMSWVTIYETYVKKSFVSMHKVTVGKKKKKKGKATVNAKLLALHANAIMIFFDIQGRHKKKIYRTFFLK